MRELGLCVTSAGSIQVVKRHVSRLGLDTSHFTGQRRWSDGQLRRAVANAYSWRELLSDLGLVPGSGDDRTRVKAHAVRLGLDLSRLDAPETAGSPGSEGSPLRDRLAAHARRLDAAGVEYRPLDGPRPWQEGGAGPRRHRGGYRVTEVVARLDGLAAAPGP